MSNDILDLPETPKKSNRGTLLLVGAVLSYGLFWLFSLMKWPLDYVFILLTSVFLIVFSLDRFISDTEKTILDYWIFFNVLLFILALTLRSLNRPYGNFVLLIFTLSAGLMFIYYFFKRKKMDNKQPF